jgi:hypothetical protein
VDEPIRAHHRAAAAGDVDAQIALLSERLRQGELLPSDLELAAHLGDPAALELAASLDLDPQTDAPLHDWLATLWRWPATVSRRAIYALATLAEERCPDGLAHPALDTLLRDYLRDPSPERRAALVTHQFHSQTPSRWQEEVLKALTPAGPPGALSRQAAQRLATMGQALTHQGVAESEVRATVARELTQSALRGDVRSSHSA